MAYILDARSTGGTVIALGETLTFPIASGNPEVDVQPSVGSMRYNPDNAELELYRSDGLGGHEWRIVERISLDTSAIFQKTGGTILGDMTMTSGARMFLPSGNISAPSLSFAASPQTGFSTDSNYVMHASVNGVDVADFDINMVTLNVPVQATIATFDTVNATSLNVTTLNTYVPREITGYYAGGFTAGQIVFRRVISHRVLVNQNWDGSIAFLQSMPVQNMGASFSIVKTANNIRTMIGNIRFAAQSIFGTFSSPIIGAFELDGGDVIEIVAAMPDTASGLSFSIATRVPLTANIAPTDINLSSNMIEERSRPGTVVGTIFVTDADSTKFNFQLLDSAGDRFAIFSNQIVVGTSQLDWSINASHQISVRVIDEDGLSFDKTLTIYVINIVDMAAYTPVRPITSSISAKALASAAFSKTIDAVIGNGTLQSLSSLMPITNLDPISAAANGQVFGSATASTPAGDILSVTNGTEIIQGIATQTFDPLLSTEIGTVFVEANSNLIMDDLTQGGQADAVVNITGSSIFNTSPISTAAATVT